MTGKTSTFTIHHDDCHPEKWTADDILAFARFIRFGDMQHAAALSRLGVRLVVSEHHKPKGGNLQFIGWSTLDDAGCASLDYVTENLDELDIDDVAPLTRIYRGPLEYVARYAIGDDQGEVEGHEFEIKPTEEEARAFLESLEEDAT